MISVIEVAMRYSVMIGFAVFIFLIVFIRDIIKIR